MPTSFYLKYSTFYRMVNLEFVENIIDKVLNMYTGILINFPRIFSFVYLNRIQLGNIAYQTGSKSWVRQDLSEGKFLLESCGGRYMI